MTLPPPLPSAPPLPLDAERRTLLERLTRDLDAATLWWLSGFLAGLASPAAGAASTPAGSAEAPPAPARPEAAAETLTVLYGSQTGNARRVAEAVFAAAGERGLEARLLRADAYPLAELKRETRMLIVISTQGDGDPPDDARGFVEHLAGRRAPRLEGLHYAVLGLGDSSYPKFCEVGRVLDARLAELGGTRLAPLGEADVDIDTVARPWQAGVLQALEALRPALPAALAGGDARRQAGMPRPRPPGPAWRRAASTRPKPKCSSTCGSPAAAATATSAISNSPSTRPASTTCRAMPPACGRGKTRPWWPRCSRPPASMAIPSSRWTARPCPCTAGLVNAANSPACTARC
jgi:sulfite reductase (NADPH) flavoprotein alpha-component